MKKFLISLLCLFLLTGCTSAKKTVENNSEDEVSTNDSLDDSFYSIYYPNYNDSRRSTYNNFSSSSDWKTVSRELSILATSYFSTNSYYLSEGQVVTQEEFQDLKSRSGDYALQPGKKEKINGVKAPVLVDDVIEQDFYKKSNGKYKLKGLAFAIVLDPLAEGAYDTALSDKTLKEYGNKCIDKLYKFIKSKEEISDKPVLITVYKGNDSTQGNFNGRYITQCYCNGKKGKKETLDYDNVIFTSTEASKLDEVTNSEFALFKNNIKKKFTESVGIVGYGRYKDGEIRSMVINMRISAKTYNEIIYVASVAADDLNSRFTNSFDIKVAVYSQDELEGFIIKKKGKDAVSSFLY